MKKLVSAIVLVFVTGVVVTILDRAEVEPPDYCPTTGYWLHGLWKVPGHTAILVDTSNEIPREDGALAFALIDSLVRDTMVVPHLQLVSMHGLPETGTHRVEQDDRRCVPLQGAMANWIYDTPRWVQIDFDRWVNRLEETFDDLVDRPEAERSPIVEAIAELVESRDSLDSIVLVSDMLQNTPLWSHYTGRGDPQAVMAACRRIATPGRVKAVYVYYIDRGLDIQPLSWPNDWWRRCLPGIRLERLNGLAGSRETSG